MKQQKQKSIGDYERDSARSGLIVGIVIIVFGVLMAYFVGRDTSLVSGIVIFVITLIAGVFAILYKKIERYVRKKNDDPNSTGFASKQKSLERQRESIYRKSRNHKSLHDETNLRYMTIAGVVLAILLTINLALLLLDGSYSILMVVLLLCSIAFFVYALTGKEYKVALAAFARYGCDEKQAEDIYKDMYLYRAIGGDMIALGDRFLMLKSVNNLIPTNKVVWIFPRLQWVYNYTNGIYTGRSNKFSITFCQSDGGFFNTVVDEAAIPLIIEDMQKLRPGVVCGFSEEISNLYGQDPAGFEAAEKTVPADPCAMLAPSEDEEPPKRK
ncbi:MAG: hypothetical protein J6I96_07055 [Oscillospiraceae bacterium]|nr:hypothetical protein [Oscillospiraceae bacterium]